MTTIGEWEAALVDLGYRLRIARQRRRWSQRSFAERMGVSKQTVERLERGDPGIRLGTLASALRVLSLPIEVLDQLADPAHDAVGLSLEIARTSRFSKIQSPEDEYDFGPKR